MDGNKGGYGADSQDQQSHKVLQTQFYSMINFHCVLNEMSGAMPDPVSAVAEQQNQN